MARTVKPGGSWIPATCTRADFAVLVGVSPRTVATLIQKKILVIAAQQNMLLTQASVEAYVSHLRDLGTGKIVADTKGPKINEEKALLAQIQRQKAEIDLAQVKGEVLTLDEVVEGWSSILVRVKADIQSIPSKLRQAIPHFGAAEQKQAKQILNDILINLVEEIELGAVGTHNEEPKNKPVKKPVRKTRKKAPAKKK